MKSGGAPLNNYSAVGRGSSGLLFHGTPWSGFSMVKINYSRSVFLELFLENYSWGLPGHWNIYLRERPLFLGIDGASLPRLIDSQSRPSYPLESTIPQPGLSGVSGANPVDSLPIATPENYPSELVEKSRPPEHSEKPSEPEDHSDQRIDARPTGVRKLGSTSSGTSFSFTCSSSFRSVLSCTCPRRSLGSGFSASSADLWFVSGGKRGKLAWCPS